VQVSNDVQERWGILTGETAVGLCCRAATGSSDATPERKLAEHGVYAQKRWECGGGEERQMRCRRRAPASRWARNRNGARGVQRSLTA